MDRAVIDRDDWFDGSGKPIPSFAVQCKCCICCVDAANGTGSHALTALAASLLVAIPQAGQTSSKQRLAFPVVLSLPISTRRNRSMDPG